MVKINNWRHITKRGVVKKNPRKKKKLTLEQIKKALERRDRKDLGYVNVPGGECSNCKHPIGYDWQIKIKGKELHLVCPNCGKGYPLRDYHN